MDYLDPVRALIPGVRGAVLSVLAHTDVELTIRQIAERSDASPTMVSKVVDDLVILGVVDRRSAGRSYQVSLSTAVAADIVRRLAGLRSEVLDRMRTLARGIEPAPRNVTVFGSFAQGTARAASDIDLLIVRPSDQPEDDRWTEAVGRFVDGVSTIAGSPVADIHISEDELEEALNQRLTGAVLREGITLAGKPLAELQRVA